MKKGIKAWRAFAGIIIVAALLLSLILDIVKPGKYSVTTNIIGYFTYFTEMSNILAAIWFLNKGFFNERFKFFNKAQVRGAINTYVWVAGIIFFLVLNKQWHAVGLTKLEEYTLHGFTPLAFFIDYILFEKKGEYKIMTTPVWYIFPFVYTFYAVGVGYLIQKYPYSFFNIQVLGFAGFIKGFAFLAIMFIVVSLFLNGVDSLFGMAKRKIDEESQGVSYKSTSKVE
ncbi:MAG: Pr6Pr family membrane protein [Sarcina sp.]